MRAARSLKPIWRTASWTTQSTSFDALEARHLAQLLKKHGGNRSKAADAAGISERTLSRKLNRLKDHLE
ncbi:MAG: helix-turn-helix domain-containing protein [Chromatiales bacterium]